MPPIAPQSSRTGLLTTLVIFVILFVTAAIFAIYFNVQLRATEQRLLDKNKEYTNVVADTAFTTPEFMALQTLQSDPQYASDKVFDIALKQRNDLAALPPLSVFK